MGPGQFFVAQVGSAIYGLGLNLENFPQNINFFLRVKTNLFGSGKKSIYLFIYKECRSLYTIQVLHLYKNGILPMHQTMTLAV